MPGPLMYPLLFQSVIYSFLYNIPTHWKRQISHKPSHDPLLLRVSLNPATKPSRYHINQSHNPIPKKHSPKHEAKQETSSKLRREANHPLLYQYYTRPDVRSTPLQAPTPQKHPTHPILAPKPDTTRSIYPLLPIDTE